MTDNPLMDGRQPRGKVTEDTLIELARGLNASRFAPGMGREYFVGKELQDGRWRYHLAWRNVLAA